MALIDLESPKYAAVSRVKDYDSVKNLIVEADVLTRGRLVGNGAEDDGNGTGSTQAAPSDSGVNLSEEERRKVEDVVAIRIFPNNTRSQLTYTGLFILASLTLESTGSSRSRWIHMTSGGGRMTGAKHPAKCRGDQDIERLQIFFGSMVRENSKKVLEESIARKEFEFLSLA